MPELLGGRDIGPDCMWSVEENVKYVNKTRGVPPHIGYMGMCRCEGYGFQAVYSSIGYINQSVWV